MRRTLFATAFAVLCLSGAVLGQCTASYQDASSEGVNVAAWDTLTDYYIDQNDSCAHWMINHIGQPPQHTYQVSVTS